VNENNLSLIFDDSPISRAYLKILIDLNFTKINLYEITNKYFFIKKINRKLNFTIFMEIIQKMMLKL